MVECDVAIVGASVAGAAVAIRLGRSGVRTVLFDKARFPRPKACGEGLLPHGVAALRAMGLGDPPGMPVAGLRYCAPSGARAEIRFADAGLAPGRVVRRLEFDAWLLGCARETPNVEVREGVAVRSVQEGAASVEVEGVRARLVVGADGIRSIFHQGRRFVRTHPGRARVGIAMHVKNIDSGEFVEVHLAEGGEAYVSPAGGGEAVLAVLADRGVKFDEFVARIPALRGMVPTTPKLGASPLRSRVKPILDGRVILAGDAAGAPDPVTGEGMSLALRSAVPACAAIVEALASGDLRVLGRYERERRRLAEPSEFLGRLILWTSRRRRLAERAVRRLARDPLLFRRLVRYLCGVEAMSVLEPVRLFL